LIRNIFNATVIVTALLLAGCTQSLPLYGNRPLGENEAIVLVGVNSPIPFHEARHCTAVVCIGWYQLGAGQEVMAYPVSVGTTFVLTSIYTRDGRTAPLKGHELQIDKKGIYYYGTIVGTHERVGIHKNVNMRLLNVAKSKYGNRFDSLIPHNFAWPGTTVDQNVAQATNYVRSEDTQKLLGALSGVKLLLTSIEPPSAFDPNCRAAGPITLPELLPYEEYIRRAINSEFAGAQLLGDTNPIVLTGTITELSFSTFGDAYWQIGLSLKNARGQSLKVVIKHPFSFGFGTMCPATEQAFMPAVQQLILAVVRHKDFGSLIATQVRE
jgi:hypothetical protein